MRVSDTILDSGLTLLDTVATAIHVCSQEPTIFSEVATYTLGNKAGSAGAMFVAPSAAANGRQCASVEITDGTVTSNGIATHWAVVTDDALLATGELQMAMTLSTAIKFKLPSFQITLPSSE